MATITKRKTGWNVQVRRKGYTPRSATLPTKAAASAWAREQEGLIDLGRLPVTDAPLKHTSLSDLIDRYLVDVTPRKRSAETEAVRLGRMKLHPTAALKLNELKPSHFAAYRDERLSVVKPGTVRREMYLFASVIDTATKEWGYAFVANPVRRVSFPIANDARDRRLEAGEAEMLHAAIASSRNTSVRPIVQLAIETGLRRREVLELTWDNIDVARRIAFIPLTKTGQPRTIPLTDAALTIIATLPRSPDQSRLFPITLNAFRHAWKRVQQRSGLSTPVRFQASGAE